MKTILFPTDFSQNAFNALKYASLIAEKTKSTLILFNAFWTPVYEFDTPIEIEKKEKKFRTKSLKELTSLEKIVKEEFPDLSVELFVSNGFTSDAITEMAESKNIDLIVMGTHGATGLMEKILGSNTVDVINKAVCPVLVIPQKAIKTEFDKIAFASNYEKEDIEQIEFLIQIGRLFNSEISIIHVTEDDFIIETADQAIIKKMNRDVKVRTNYEKLKYKLLKGDVIEELEKYVSSNNIDLLSMVTSKKHFLNKLFNKSYTNKMAFQIKIPLLVLHRNKGEVI